MSDKAPNRLSTAPNRSLSDDEPFDELAPSKEPAPEGHTAEDRARFATSIAMLFPPDQQAQLLEGWDINAAVYREQHDLDDDGHSLDDEDDDDE